MRRKKQLINQQAIEKAKAFLALSEKESKQSKRLQALEMQKQLAACNTSMSQFAKAHGYSPPTVRTIIYRWIEYGCVNYFPEESQSAEIINLIEEEIGLKAMECIRNAGKR